MYYMCAPETLLLHNVALAEAATKCRSTVVLNQGSRGTSLVHGPWRAS